MTGGESVAAKSDRRADVLRSFGFAALGAAIVFIVWMFTRPLSAEWIWIQYPIGQSGAEESILIVQRSHAARLRQSGQEEVLRGGTFDIDRLFQELLGQLVNTWDEDKRVDRAVGVVRIWFSDETSGTYLIYDKGYCDELFDWARDNRVQAP
jgi:hypothetical protein